MASPVDYSKPWMLTISGRAFSFTDPEPDISIRDIAYGLSRQPRFNGHTRGEPYSVAQHCCLALDVLKKRWGLIPPDTNMCLWALFHDAEEAYLPDLHTDVQTMISGYRSLKSGIQVKIFKYIGMRSISDSDYRFLKKIDRDLMYTEMVQLMRGLEDHNKDFLKGAEVIDGLTIHPWTRDDAYREFLNNSRELGLDIYD